MSKRKIGLAILAVGTVVLLVALLLLFNTNSSWAPVCLGMSVLLNTAGLSVLTARHPKQPRRGKRRA